MKLSEIIREVISMAKAAGQAREATSSEDDSPMVTSGSYTSMTKPLKTEERRLRDFLAAQPPAVIYMLLAIRYLGRGDFEAKALLDQYADLSETFGDPKWAARQMLETMLLAEHLQAGSKRLRDAGIKVDELPVQ